MRIVTATRKSASALQRYRLGIALIIAAITQRTSAGNSESLNTQGGLLRAVIYERSGATLDFLSHANPGELLVSLLLLAVPLFMIYGACMGLPGGLRQTVASAAKTPLIFLCTLAVCFPVLAMLAILTGLNLGVTETAILVLLSLVLNALLLACCAPLCAFFAVSSDYHFMKLLHVTIFALCGAVSSAVLFKSLQGVALRSGIDPGNGMFLFLLWMITYGFVGLQMAWTLRPMIGDPGLPFHWLRRRTSGMSVYTAISLSINGVGNYSNPEPMTSSAHQSENTKAAG